MPSLNKAAFHCLVVNFTYFLLVISKSHTLSLVFLLSISRRIGISMLFAMFFVPNTFVQRMQSVEIILNLGFWATMVEKSAKTDSKVVGAILGYSFVSIGIIYLNRFIFTTSLPYPVFVSWFQQLFGLLVLWTFASLKRTWPQRFSWVAPLEIQADVAWRIFPLSFCFVMMVGLANMCLKYVQISTYQTARALTLIFNLILTKLVLKVSNSTLSWLACFVVIIGFVIGSLDPSTLSISGLVPGTLSSLFQAIYSVYIKKNLGLVNDNVTSLLYYNLFWSSFLFVPLIFVCGESGVLSDIPTSTAEPGFGTVWGSLFVSGVLGISITFVSYLCIQVTSPVTFNIVGYAKACFQTIGGIIIFGEHVTAQSLFAISLTLLGSFWYSQVKRSEEKARAAALPKALELEETKELQKYAEDISPSTKASTSDGGASTSNAMSSRAIAGADDHLKSVVASGAD